MLSEMESKRMFKSLIETSHNIVLITDVIYKIKYITGSVEQLLGFKAEDTLGKSLLKYINPDRRASLQRFVQTGNQEEQTKLTEVKLLGDNGKTCFFDVTITNLLENSQVEGIVFNLHDITDRKRVEERLTKANNELDQFIYKTSHDLRAPLLSALGLVQLAQKDPDKEKHDYLGMIHKSLVNLDNFIEDLNSFYRNEKLAIQSESINFKTIINEEVDQLTNFYNADYVNVELKLSRIADFRSDSLRIKTIFTNLISNSFKYSDITKDYSYLKIQVNVTPDLCDIKVEDNGIGIREEYLENIFDIFYRADENAKGSGLGLYIVKDTIDKLGGQIEVHSAYGKGTSFTISIPNSVV